MMITIEATRDSIRIVFPQVTPGSTRAVFVAIGTDIASGCAVVPFAQGREGSTVFLPFRADAIFSAHLGEGGSTRRVRRWKGTQWGGESAADDGFFVEPTGESVSILISPTVFHQGQPLRLTAYVKDMEENGGWGSVLEDDTFRASAGHGDRYISRYVTLTPHPGETPSITPPRERLGSERIRIYQLLPRLFGNTNPTRKPNGKIEENGCGKFADISDRALASIRELGITHVWLTGVLQQATATDYSSIGAPADDPDLLKGLAGSPYAIKDYFDLCPDHATDPAKRHEEFRALLERIHRQGMRALIDFVPNHVARCYESDIRPESSFGRDDDRSKFFDPQNNFYYLRAEDHGHGPPLRLPSLCDGEAVSPTCRVLSSCDGLFSGETEFGRVTGNNVISWAPGLNDWYETVKLNYGYNFTDGTREYPHGDAQDKPIPDTWLKMDRIIGHWQELGVDGFRCDMAHMVPPEFWSWLIGRARTRQPEVFFTAEAYDNDPAKVPSGDPLFHALNDRRGNVMFDLLSAGFDAVYDDPSYKKLKSIYDGSGWANDLEDAHAHDFIFHNSLRYAENHDEVRLAGRHQWGGIGMNVGRAVAGILFGMGRGPVMLYHGQEVGEPADGSEGFSGDNARTTIFDYWSMPEFSKWVNEHRYDGGQLSPEQRSLREFYGRLLHVIGEPAFVDGDFHPLNPANIHNSRFGTRPGEQAGGHWLHAFMRANRNQRFLVVANLHPHETLRNLRIQAPHELLAGCGIRPGAQILLKDRLNQPYTEIATIGDEVLCEGFPIPEVPPLSSLYLAMEIISAK